MAWEVEFTDEFEAWWDSLSIAEQESIAIVVNQLAIEGTALEHPYSSQILGIPKKGGRKPAPLRELRIQHAGRPYRILYAFDPLRTAILLLGADKTGDARWYDTHIPIALRLYAEHVAQLKKEGKLPT